MLRIEYVGINKKNKKNIIKLKINTKNAETPRSPRQ